MANLQYETRVDRRLAAITAASLLVLGLVGVVQIVAWGADPLWGFVILPPVVFFVVLSWIAFRTELSGDDTGA